MADGDPSASPPGLVKRAGRGITHILGRGARAVHRQAVQAIGGPARARVIVLFAAVLGLSAADASTVGAAAPQLEHALHIGNTKIGLLSSVSLLVGAVFVIPFGVLVDRFKRIPILSASILLWSAASLLGAFATSYEMLLFTRLALGAVIATAGPAIASLTGDYFPARERGRVYAFILAGESAGTAVGFIVSSSLASAVSWRASFALLAVPGVFIARTLWRTVPEPLRGGQSNLEVGMVDLGAAVSPAGSTGGEETGPDRARRPHGLAQQVVVQHGVEPDPKLVLKEDPDQMGLLRAIRYTLRVPTNLVLITSSALGYFYFGGLQTFALLFIRGHYHAGSGTAELVLASLVIGSIVGTLISGRLTDGLLRRGMLDARIFVPIICYLSAAGLLVPGLLATQLSVAIWFDIAGAALLTAANPGLDAARLDIMPSGLWGRAESTRTFLRSLGQAAAPLAFGGVSDLIAGIVPAQVPVSSHTPVVSASEARGLEYTFLAMLISLVAAGLFLFRARKTYPRDIATASASEEAEADLPRG